jgi:hypothetical protein
MYKTVESIPTEYLHNYHEFNDKLPLTEFSHHLRPIFNQIRDSDLELIQAREELAIVETRVAALSTPEKPMDHEPHYLEWLNLRHSLPKLKKNLASISSKVVRKLNNDSKRQREALLVEIARRRLLGVP